MSKHDHHYYVDMPHSPIMFYEQLEEFHVGNLDDNLDVLQDNPLVAPNLT